MIEKDVADTIATALHNEDLQSLTVEELGELSILHYHNDPDVEFIDLDYTPDAGIELHGMNTEEEMLKTVGVK